MHHRLYYHIVWTTRDRAPSIDGATARFLVRYLPPAAERLGAQVLESGLVSTHVHLLVRVPPTTRLPVLLQSMKGGSAAAANREVRTSSSGKLHWAHGYSASSVSEAALDRIRRYVRRQFEHHPHEVIPGWLGEP